MRLFVCARVRAFPCVCVRACPCVFVVCLESQVPNLRSSAQACSDVFPFQAANSTSSAKIVQKSSSLVP